MAEKTDKIFKVSNKKGHGEIILYADIGGWFGVNSLEFLQAVSDMGNVNTVDFRVSSEGGSVLTAIDMFNAIRRHQANWTAHIDGLAASSASWLVLATNKVLMADNAQYMIHRASSPAGGTADDLRKTADLIESIEQTAMVNAYTKKTGMTNAAVMELLNAETWMIADKAKELGFVDEVTETMQMAASARLSGRYAYTHPPESLMGKNTVDDKTETPLLQAAKRRNFETFNSK